MFYIRKVHIHEQYSETWKQVEDPARAYELAHMLHAATMGLSSDDELNEKHEGPFTVHIVDDEGKSAWGKCARVRCPTPTGVAMP